MDDASVVAAVAVDTANGILSDETHSQTKRRSGSGSGDSGFALHARWVVFAINVPR
jgi:hypothetical protein